ncbi:hypothetical protein DID75_00880 [Candidatus Marinamargulisbacteria bacterium SCGC AG-410-N11]|nr:hypothetical protein DID75_00880 [Candidatus Marinamargulisbacteria bacterium SCGC AG-410-N11]
MNSGSKKIALINGKLVDVDLNKSDVTNILFVNNKVMGVGYIPDDDDSIVIDAKNSWLLQDTYAFYQLNKKDIDTIGNNLPFENFKLGIGTPVFIIPKKVKIDKDSSIYSLVVELGAKLIVNISEYEQSELKSEIVGVYLADKILDKEIEMISDLSLGMPVIIDLKSIDQDISEYVSRINQSIHCLVTSKKDVDIVQQLKLVHARLTSSLSLSSVKNFKKYDLLEYFKNESIHSFFLDGLNLNVLEFIDILKTQFEIIDIAKMISSFYSNLLKIKLKKVGLFKSPNITILKEVSESKFKLSIMIFRGEVVYSDNEKKLEIN